TVEDERLSWPTRLPSNTRVVGCGSTGGSRIPYFQPLRHKGDDLVPKGAEQPDTTGTHDGSPPPSEAHDGSPPPSEAHDGSPPPSEAHHGSPLSKKEASGSIRREA